MAVEKYNVMYWHWKEQEWRIQPNFEPMTIQEFQEKDLEEKGFKLNIPCEHISSHFLHPEGKLMCDDCGEIW